MTEEFHVPDARPEGRLLRSADQATVAVLLSFAIVAIVGSWAYRGGLQGRLIDIEAAQPQLVTFELEINTADWPEWTLLPGIGETLAKRIVESRESEGPFRNHADVMRVRGIGPRTLERIRPYFTPLREDGPGPDSRESSATPSS